MEKFEFIKIMLNNRNLSVNDKKRLLLLATKEVEKNDSVLMSATDDVNLDLPATISAKNDVVHLPKETASFLSLFNDPKGLKFLTHDFDPESDMNYDSLMNLARSVFKDGTAKYHIPKNLYALINTFINGGKVWMDCDGDFHSENYSSRSWSDWAHQNPKVHLLSNELFSKTILKFRSSIRLVKPILSDIIKKQANNHSNLIIQSEGLEKADFYTYVWNLENGIKRILEDMSRYSGKSPNVKISFDRKYGDDYCLRIIRLTQIGSVSTSLDDVLNRFHSTEGAGAFNEIKKVFAGYCNWSVEALWDGKPKRWNILTDSTIPEVEELKDSNIDGFTHILTYYSK